MRQSSSRHGASTPTGSATSGSGRRWGPDRAGVIHTTAALPHPGGESGRGGRLPAPAPLEVAAGHMDHGLGGPPFGYRRQRLCQHQAVRGIPASGFLPTAPAQICNISTIAANSIARRKYSVWGASRSSPGACRFLRIVTWRVDWAELALASLLVAGTLRLAQPSGLSRSEPPDVGSSHMTEPSMVRAELDDLGFRTPVWPGKVPSVQLVAGCSASFVQLVFEQRVAA